MDAKHTPGPWRVAYLDCNRQSVVMGEHIEIATCWHHSVGSIEKEMHANARLISVAPELLEAGEEFAAYEKAMDEGDDMTAINLYASFARKMHAAIAKAKGPHHG